MGHVELRAMREFAGSPAITYGILADYHEGHPSILPPKHFPYLTVERGGTGAGTVIRFGLKLVGRVQEACADVFEPEPGRVLVERVRDARGTETRFTVESSAPGRVRVTIGTTWTARGPLGAVERWLAPKLLLPVYEEELVRLEAAVSRSRQGQ